MRLINTHTLELRWFQDRNVPAYAILSHTWEDEEIDFQQFTQQRDEPATRAKKGFVKIEQTCRLARKSGIDWAWVDTCCIDKSDSAELTEAINSMFRWYAESEVCFAYLSDLKPGGGRNLAKCRWFTRGWTLQELIAPRRLEFYNREWQCEGNKSLLGRELASITGIRPSVLRDPRWLQSISVAERMSWASGRQTTRVEDQAYCLLGIFGITMPLLYGEREKAFIRLQEEIIKETNDFSIFAWRVDADRAARQKYWGILAPSADEFAGWRDADMPYEDPINASECITTNKGLRVAPVQGGGLLARPDGTYAMRLNCYYSGRRHDGQISVCLQKLGHATYARVRADELLTMPFSSREKTNDAVFYISKTVSPQQSERWGSPGEGPSIDLSQVLAQLKRLGIRPLNEPASAFDPLTYFDLETCQLRLASFNGFSFTVNLELALPGAHRGKALVLNVYVEQPGGFPTVLLGYPADRQKKKEWLHQTISVPDGKHLKWITVRARPRGWGGFEVYLVDLDKDDRNGPPEGFPFAMKGTAKMQLPDGLDDSKRRGPAYYI